MCCKRTIENENSNLYVIEMIQMKAIQCLHSNYFSADSWNGFFLSHFFKCNFILGVRTSSMHYTNKISVYDSFVN